MTQKTKAQVKVQSDKIYVKIPYKERMKINTTAKWIKDWKCWELPHTVFAGYVLCENFQIEHSEIRRLHDRYLQALDVKCSDYNELDDIPYVDLSAWPHQRGAFWYAVHIKNVLLAMDMGTGKSYVATGLISNKRGKRKVLIVCPKSVAPVWPKELARSEYDFHIEMFNNTGESVKQKSERLRMKLKWCKHTKKNFVCVVHYDIFWRDNFGTEILKHFWNVVIFDECHRLKSPTGKAGKFAVKVANCADTRIGLSGTPMPHSPLDIFNQYRVLDWSVFGQFFGAFKKRYTVMGGFGGKQVVGYKNKQELKKRIEAISFWVDKSVLQLPGIVVNERRTELSVKSKKVYNDLDNKFFVEVEKGRVTAANALVKLLRLQQLTSGYLKQDDGSIVQIGTEKLDLFKDLLNDFPKEEPLVVFCWFTQDINNVVKACNDEGRTTSVLSGHYNQLADWQAGETDVLVAQMSSGSEGIDLTRACYCIYYSVGHSLGKYDQSLARCHRPGQTRTTFVYHLLVDYTVDVQVFSSLKHKKEIIESILQGREYNLNK